jgi:acetyl-CoA carboxylase carboxyl transferase subunit alpha
MQFLEFEQPIADLYSELEKIKEVAENSGVDTSATTKDLESRINEEKKNIYGNLTSWQKVQLSRHPDRPYTTHYLERICEPFIELFGDRNVKDDKAIIGGLGKIDGQTAMFIGHQKGVNTKMRQYRNFGMANPEGYRKALRLMKLAEKFNKPIVCLIDTPGAYPGLEAEERGQGEAIARNLYEMMSLKVPILWRNWDNKEIAADALKLTAQNMNKFKLVDGIIKEPLGGAHYNYDQIALTLKKEIKKHLSALLKLNPDERIEQRINKFSNMGIFEEA